MKKSNSPELPFKMKNPSAICYCCGSFLLMCNKAEGFCHFCEAYNLLDGSAPENPMSEKFYGIQMLLESRDYQETENALDKMIKSDGVQQSVTVLFGAASIYRTLADAAYYARDYGLKGFMEQNSFNVYHSLDLTSKYKTLFYKVIKLAETDSGKIFDSNMAYLGFVSCLKVKNYHKARKFLESLQKAAKGLELEYAEVAFAVDSGNSINPEAILSLISRGSSNSIYYLAKSYIKKKQVVNAKSILERLNSRVNMPDSVYLLGRINQFLKETEL